MLWFKKRNGASETAEPGGGGGATGQDSQHQGEAPQGRAEWPMTIINVKLNPILINLCQFVIFDSAIWQFSN